MIKTCLNCLYEPDWGKWVGKEYRRQVGQCKFVLKIPIVPAVYRIIKEPVVRYADDSGVITCCKAWKPKQIIAE